MTILLETETYQLNNNKVEIIKIYDKYLGTYFETYINGEKKPTRYSWLKRYTKPTKSEIKKYIEKNY